MTTGPSEDRLGEGLEMAVTTGIFARLGRSLPNCWPTFRNKAGLPVLLILGLPRRRMYVVKKDVTPSITPVQTLIPARSLEFVWATKL